jgi:V/A-type H+-transporting ATPase subunit D
MSKIKLTKGELKRQRDALSQYARFLPTLQLKKQQLQIEILRQHSGLNNKKQEEESKIRAAQSWLGLLSDAEVKLGQWVAPQEIVQGIKNIAGVDLPVFDHVVFGVVDYDLFLTPLWVDAAVEELRKIVSLRQEIRVIEEGIKILKEELRITSQRVNLFEKVKIPEAREAIRLIKIYLGDQMANAVGRSKIAKKKISEATLYEAVAS